MVPDLAIVPRLFIKSSLVIPTPVSVIINSSLSWSVSILIDMSGSFSNSFVSDRDRNLILSKASEALDTASLKNISLFVYKELIIISSSLDISA